MIPVEIEWAPLATPRTPAGLVAFGRAAIELLQRLKARADDKLGALRVASGSSAIVLLGDPDQLPWSDGVVYIGRHPDAPKLYLPTHSEPLVPVDLLATAIEQRISKHNVVVCRTPAALLPVESSQMLQRQVLEHWLEEH